jgi:subtilisin family serine protease
MKTITFKLRLAAILLILGLFTAHASDKLDPMSRYFLKPYLENPAKYESYSILRKADVRYPFELTKKGVMVDVLIETQDNALIDYLKANKAIVKIKIGSVYSVKLPVEILSSVINDARLEKIQVKNKISKLLDQSRPEIGAHKVHEGLGLKMPYTGKGVIVGVLDTGIDFNHEDFKDDNGSRILYLWDMSDNSGTNMPQGYTWGREYTKAEMDADPASVKEIDGDGGSGHGTHVTGTAAGNGRTNKDMSGIAPEADIIFVKVARDSASYGSFESNDIMAGCQYIFEKAQQLGRPAVINLSLGSPLGSHDGEALDEKALTQLTGKGRIIVAAAGNEGQYAIHSGTDASSGESIEAMILPINVCELFEDFCPDIPGIFMTAADIWTDEGVVDSVAVGLYGEQGFISETVIQAGNFVQNLLFKDDTTKAGYVNIDAIDPEHIFLTISNNGDTEIEVDNYMWSIRFRAKGEGSIDLWAGIPVPEGVPFYGQNGRQIQGNTSMTISNYASAKSIVGVGSYISRNSWTDIDSVKTELTYLELGKISDFSSQGPTRDGRLAPVISAPGDVVFAPLSSHMTEGEGYYRSWVLAGGGYQGMSGTSMATPHITGVIALMLQANPMLDYDDIVSIFEKTSRKDSYTGDVPNYYFGHGKVDAYKAMQELTTGVEDDKRFMFKIYPNPAADFLAVELPILSSSYRVSVHDALGSVVMNKEVQGGSGAIQLKYSVSNLSPGIYFITFTGSDFSERQKFIILK